MSEEWAGGSDTRWRTLRAHILRLHLPESMRPSCAIGTPDVCTHKATCVDHIIPLSMGGEKYNPTNCRPACKECNNHRNTTINKHEYEPEPRRVSNW